LKTGGILSEKHEIPLAAANNFVQEINNGY
jgi:hypothetical protein